MTQILLAAIAVAAGFLLALQPAVNAEIVRASGVLFIAAFVSVAITLLLLSVPALNGLRVAHPGWMKAMPW